MLGVVLWSDTQEHKAVIWCEDHGELAYYSAHPAPENPRMDTGDLVQFELGGGNRQRRARNPRLIAEGVCADLADQLSLVGQEQPSEQAPHREPECAKVVSFPRASNGTPVTV